MTLPMAGDQLYLYKHLGPKRTHSIILTPMQTFNYSDSIVTVVVFAVAAGV